MGGQLLIKDFIMKYIIILLFLFISCTEKRKKGTTDFNEKIVDFAIEKSNDNFIELPNLYDSSSKEIVAKDEDEKVILVQILKKKGFKITNWGRGNHPLGPRIVVLNLKKDSCECEVQKVYYAYQQDTIYNITERIKCEKFNR